MSRFIDADSCERLMAKRAVKNYKDALEALWDTPTVDAVPVVHCKDCKWLGIGAKGDGTKLILCIKKHHDTTEDDYCSEGVNREDDPSD